MSEKKRYYFTAQVSSVYGSQTYYADAESQEEAFAIVEGGDGVFQCEELEVQDLDAWEFSWLDDVPKEA
jgi:hypothetical protein